MALPQCEGRLDPIAIITRDDVVERFVSHINLPAAPTPIGPGGSLAWDLGDESIDDRVVGVNSEPTELDVTQRGPPQDECVDPPAPDC